MSNKKLQVFVSSTFEDLKEERQAAVEAILSAGHIPAGMELFTAGDETQMTVIKRWIDESDVYLLILGGRYGSVDKVSGKSYTQLEYEYAVEIGKPLFAVVMNEDALEEKVKKYGSKMRELDNPKEFKLFREVAKTKMIRYWDDKKDIKIAIHETLNDFNYRKELTGWVRGDNAINTSTVAEELARLGKENEELKTKLNVPHKETLYNGLTYDELRKILITGKVVYEHKTMYLIDFLLKFGDQFLHGWIVYDNIENNFIFDQLRLYKIIQIDAYGYTFTEDGHNFYLKALALQNEENNS